MEGVFSFFLESSFLGLFLYGEKRLGPKADKPWLFGRKRIEFTRIMGQISSNIAKSCDIWN